MRMLHLIPALALTACMTHADTPYEATAEAQEALADRLAGRVAGPPVSCVRSQDLRGNTPIDERTILFETRGELIYVNRTRSSCAGLRPWHGIRVRTVGTQICEGEPIETFDPGSGVAYGSCSLGEFVPYRRPA